MNHPLFGTREVYDALAEALNDDPKWLAKAQVLNYTMTHVYTEPVNKTFTFRFEAGKLLDVRDVDGPAPADFVLTGSPAVWERMLVAQTISPQIALVTRKIAVEGKMSVLLKNISVFNYLLAVLIALEPVMSAEERVTLWEPFAGHAAAQPDKVAIVSHRVGDARSQVVSYGQLARLAERFAGALVELNVAPGEVVSFQLPNWWEVAALHLACVRIGAVANPIITILRRREVGFILDRVRCRVCIVPGEFRGFDHAAMVAGLRAEVPTLEHVFVCGAPAGAPLPDGLERFEEFFCDTRWEDKHPAAELDGRRPAPGDPAQIMFTSGTTGEPKGVLHSHATMDFGLRAVSEPLGLDGDDVVLMFSPLGHQTGYLYGMCMPLRYGMKLVLQDVWDPATMLRLVGDERVTWTMGTTTFVLDACAAAGQHPEADLSSLRFFTCGGAPIPPKAVTEARARLGTQLVAVWGMTEIGVCTITRPDDTDATVCASDGVPVDWAELRIVDGDGADVPSGDDGRLLARTPSQHLTYHGRHDLYASSFPFGVEAAWFDTGDLARMAPDGSIRITGRSKDLIIRGGENIPVAEVEAAIITHPLVHEVAVVAVPDERLGEKVCAVIVPARDAAPTLDELRAHLESQGMAKPFWPERLVVKDALPKTASGKTQKFALREELAAL